MCQRGGEATDVGKEVLEGKAAELRRSCLPSLGVPPSFLGLSSLFAPSLTNTERFLDSWGVRPARRHTMGAVAAVGVGLGVAAESWGGQGILEVWE